MIIKHEAPLLRGTPEERLRQLDNYSKRLCEELNVKDVALESRLLNLEGTLKRLLSLFSDSEDVAAFSYLRLKNSIKEELYNYVTNDNLNEEITKLEEKIPVVDGDGGGGISSVNINGKGELVIEYTDGRSENLGVVKGGKGDTGTTPQLRINSGTNEWEVSYDLGVTWESLGVRASGEKGDSQTPEQIQALIDQALANSGFVTKDEVEELIEDALNTDNDSTGGSDDNDDDNDDDNYNDIGSLVEWENGFADMVPNDTDDSYKEKEVQTEENTVGYTVKIYHIDCAYLMNHATAKIDNNIKVTLGPADQWGSELFEGQIFPIFVSLGTGWGDESLYEVSVIFDYYDAENANITVNDSGGYEMYTNGFEVWFPVSDAKIDRAKIEAASTMSVGEIKLMRIKTISKGGSDAPPQ